MANKLCTRCKQIFSSESGSCPYCGSKEYETIIDKNTLQERDNNAKI